MNACATITNAGTIENTGTLVLKQATNADIAAIKALKLTGSGYVKVVDRSGNEIPDAYYTNTGAKITILTT